MTKTPRDWGRIMGTIMAALFFTCLAALGVAMIVATGRLILLILGI